MGRSKSPTDELVDGIDAIGTILDENLPEINSRIASLANDSRQTTDELARIKNLIGNSEETNTETRKAIGRLEVRVEEVMQTIAAMTRRIDLLHKTILELSAEIPEQGYKADGGLADTVKLLEDRLKLVEKGIVDPKRFTDRF